MQETSRGERRVLAESLTRTIGGFLKRRRAVHLEGLGIIFPRLESRQRKYVVGNMIAVRKEETVRPDFEKCSELSQFIREKFERPAEMRELAARLMLAVPFEFQVRYSVDQIRFLLTGLIALIRRETVVDGYSNRLAPFINFYALHNRHGSEIEDWFAGADIFVSSNFERIESLGQAQLFPRPALQSSFELLEAACGAAHRIFPLNIGLALGELGITSDESVAQQGIKEIEVGVFRRKGKFLFVTKGLCQILKARTGSEALPGQEILLEVGPDDSLPVWPFMAIALIIHRLLTSSEHNTAAKGHHAATELIPVPKGVAPTKLPSSIGGFLTWADSRVPPFQLADGKEFTLLYGTALTTDEVELAMSRGSDHLFEVLARRGLTTTCRSDRASVLQRSHVLLQPTPTKVS